METMEEQLEGDNKKVFLQFLRSMIRWIPEERPTAEEAIYDDWLMEGLIDPAPKES
jgi:serine/threonine-protein kinase SRPK3